MTAALFLLGSPKTVPSTSGALSKYLARQLRKCGVKTHTCPIGRIASVNEAFFLKLDESDIIILATPLYVDCLPYPVIHALEAIAFYRQTIQNPKTQRFMCMVNCGFPEPRHNDTALAICRKFAQEVGFTWDGGLALGGGEAIGGKSLETLGWMTRNVRRSLDLTAQDLASGQGISGVAAGLMAKPLIPGWIYSAIANFRFKRKAKRNRAFSRFYDHPYA